MAARQAEAPAADAEPEEASFDLSDIDFYDDEIRSPNGHDRDGHERQELDSEDLREGVVQNAVGDECVAAAVPEVVPERETVPQKQRTQIRMSREITSRRAQPHECRCRRGRARGRAGRPDRAQRPMRQRERVA